MQRFNRRFLKQRQKEEKKKKLTDGMVKMSVGISGLNITSTMNKILVISSVNGMNSVAIVYHSFLDGLS